MPGLASFHNLPNIGLAELGELDEALVLCSTSRLARRLRRAHDEARLARGDKVWRPLKALTLAQWLYEVSSTALLCGHVAPESAPALILSELEERIVWERAIESSSEAYRILFDRDGLAASAQEAHRLLETWGIELSAQDAHLDETAEFLRWRAEFSHLCQSAGWFDGARALAWQLACVEQVESDLPKGVAFAGFDRMNPQEVRLLGILARRGVAIFRLAIGNEAGDAADTMAHEFADIESECRAAAAWAKAELAQDETARLAIVVPELAAVRETLADALDAALTPQAFAVAMGEMARPYNFSLGLPLADAPLVATALALLRLAIEPRRIALADFSALLCAPYWSADVGEADDRARFDAGLREKLAPEVSLERILRELARAAQRGLVPPFLPHLAADLRAMTRVREEAASRQRPSAWAATFERMLQACRWPGERALSSHEYQTQQAFLAALQALGQLDGVSARIDGAEAWRRFSALCRERIFQPETENEPRLEVIGLLEAAATPYTAIWVMGMNDHVWPPPAHPNPLLPATPQRRARAPNSCAQVQSEFAQAIHRRLLASAAQVRFSYARCRGERELAASPLIAGVPRREFEHRPQTSLAQALAGGAVLEHLGDAVAPPVRAGEAVKGGTALLRAQAICPAWAFYAYRLGAKALVVPADELGARERGNLVHALLQQFWRGRGSQALAAMDVAERGIAVALAADLALAEFNAQRPDALGPRAQRLERERLRTLALAWLALEAQRKEPFGVIACEEKRELDIEGIRVKVVIDRVDELADGRRVIIDYKTGSAVSQSSWAQERISEPQLPIYAALSEPDPARLAAVALARVRLDRCAFVGIAADGGLLPRVCGITEKAARRSYPQFAQWPQLLTHWRACIETVAREIRDGVAAVSFAREQDLAYCEVLPLLRLPERKAQMELRAGETP